MVNMKNSILWEPSNLKSKQYLFKKLQKNLAQHKESTRIIAKRKGINIDLGLVNFYGDTEFLKFFADIWVDWEPRLGAKLMIVGQDWGPYIEMRKIADKVKDEIKVGGNLDDVRYKFINNSTHRTTKFLFQAIEENAKRNNINLPENPMDYVFVTMAVLFARQGKGFRGNHNFEEKYSAELSRPFLKEQIEIVKPTVILTLGSLATDSVLKIFGSDMKATLTKTIEEYMPDNYTFPLNAKNVLVIPSFHPASHVSQGSKLDQWDYIWKYL